MIAPPPADAKKVTLLYSSNLDGEYDAHPLGGLARRATMTTSERASGPVIQVDAGDSWLPRMDQRPQRPAARQGRDRAARPPDGRPAWAGWASTPSPRASASC